MSHIVVESTHGIFSISISRADKKNALTQVMYKQMGQAIIDAQQDDKVKVILLKSQGDIFTAGNDMHDFAKINQTASDDKNVDDNLIFMRALMECKLPVVAQVQGLAVGIGTTMLLHCDIVVCSDKSRFSMPFVDLGLVPEFASSYLVPQMAGHRKASKWLLLGETFNAQEAEQNGFVSEVVTLDNLHQRVEQITHALALKPKQALLSSKALMKSDQGKVSTQMRNEMEVFVKMLKTTAAQEAFNAFIEKRSPDRKLYQ